jgi:GNAT superfamily N-acetyltransferase
MNARVATLDDLETIIKLLKIMGLESPIYRRFTPDDEKIVKVLTSFIQSPSALVLVLDDETGFFIGHIETTLWFVEKFAWEDLLFVLPEKRGTKRAYVLMNAFEEWAMKQNIAEIRLGIGTGVEEQNTAIFFRKLGYLPSGSLFMKEV